MHREFLPLGSHCDIGTLTRDNAPESWKIFFRFENSWKRPKWRKSVYLSLNLYVSFTKIDANKVIIYVVIFKTGQLHFHCVVHGGNETS